MLIPWPTGTVSYLNTVCKKQLLGSKLQPTVKLWAFSFITCLFFITYFSTPGCFFLPSFLLHYFYPVDSSYLPCHYSFTSSLAPWTFACSFGGACPVLQENLGAFLCSQVSQEFTNCFQHPSPPSVLLCCFSFWGFSHPSFSAGIMETPVQSIISIPQHRKLQRFKGSFPMWYIKGFFPPSGILKHISNAHNFLTQPFRIRYILPTLK